MATSVTARVDFENNAEKFWDAFRDQVATLDRDSELATNCREILKRDEVELLDADAIQQFDDFVTGLPGWDNGPEHAKNPIIFAAN